MSELSALQEKIGYVFANEDLLRLALTHSSYANETRGKVPTCAACNERLEFLGDSVLQLISGEFLYGKYPSKDEGKLSKARSFAVCEDALCGYAKTIGLGDWLLLGHGEQQNDGRHKKSLLADAFEALIAAIFLDAGPAGYDEARRFVLPFLSGRVSEIKDDITSDYKTALQQLLQSADSEKPVYVTTAEHGPDHAKTFDVEVLFSNNVIGEGTGTSRREAEQMAARRALELFGEISEDETL